MIRTGVIVLDCEENLPNIWRSYAEIAEYLPLFEKVVNHTENLIKCGKAAVDSQDT